MAIKLAALLLAGAAFAAEPSKPIQPGQAGVPEVSEVQALTWRIFDLQKTNLALQKRINELENQLLAMQAAQFGLGVCKDAGVKPEECVNIDPVARKIVRPEKPANASSTTSQP